MVPPQIQDQVADFHQLCRVQTNGRFVEDQHRRVAEDRHGKSHTLLIALGEVPDQPLLHVSDLEAFHDTFHFALAFCRRNAFQTGSEVQIFPHLHIRIDRRDLRQKADASLCFDRLLGDVIALDLDAAAGGGNDTCHNI